MTFWTSSTEAESFALGAAVVFGLIGVSIVVYLQRRKASAQPLGVALAGSEMRVVFLTILAIANLARAASIFIDVAVRREVKASALAPSWKSWVREVLSCLPSLFFASAYSSVVLFWAQVYYAAVMIPFPLLRPTFAFVNAGVYAIFTVIALITLHMAAWTQAVIYINILLGVVFIADAIGLFVFGVRVASHLSERRERLAMRRGLIRRVLLLTTTVPLVLLLRGSYCLLRGYLGGNPLNVARLAWDVLLFTVSECLPSLLFIFAFRAGAEQQEDGESFWSSEGKSPLLFEDRDVGWRETERCVEEALAERVVVVGG